MLDPRADSFNVRAEKRSICGSALHGRGAMFPRRAY